MHTTLCVNLIKDNARDWNEKVKELGFYNLK